MPICSVSVDLDPLSCYYGIHGLGAPPAQLRDVVLHRALPRFAELFERRRIKATFFIVGSDLVHDAAGKKHLGALARAGHELGNHSFTHPYDLCRLSRTKIEEEVVAGAPDHRRGRGRGAGGLPLARIRHVVDRSTTC